MTRLYILLCSQLLICAGLIGQNLVPNPSFETVTSCPNFASQIDKAAPWFNPNAGTPELFHGCATWGSYVSVPATSTGGFQYARTGVGYAGLYVFRSNIPDMREYIEVPLTNPLVAGQCYYFEMYVNQPNDHELTCDGIGARFSNGVLQPPTSGFVMNLPAHIDNSSGTLLADTTGWMKISGSYTAQGGEDHLVIGNFRDNANTVWSFLQGNVWYENSAYLYVDDVSVTPFDPNLDLGNDTLLCDGSSILLDATYPGATYLWNDGSTAATLTAAQTGTYWVEVFAGSCSERDTVVVDHLNPPSIDLGPDVEICQEKEVLLELSANTVGNILWSDGSSALSMTTSLVGDHWVSVANACGSHSDTIQISMGECLEDIYIPNAFSPNGDGINDFFYPVYDSNVQEIILEIFDRWGTLIHTIRSDPWDGTRNGKELPNGVYVWKMNSTLKGAEVRIGHITLIR